MAYPRQFIYTTKKLPVLFIIHPALKDVVVHRHWHDDVELNYTLSDTIDDFMIENHHFHTTPGRILVVNSDEIHGVRSHQASADGHEPAALTLVFPLAYLQDCYADINQIKFDLNHPENFTAEQQQAYRELQQLLNQLMGLFTAEQNELTILKIRALLMLLVTTMIEHFGRQKLFALPNSDDKQTRINTITDYIEHHYQEHLQIQDIAAAVHLSKEYLVRFFKANLDTTPYQYLAYVRCQKAQVALLHSEDTLTTIAINTGFGSLRAMDRTFQKYTHSSARNWRIKNQARQ